MADLDLATILADGEYLKREGDTLVGEIPAAGGAGGSTILDGAGTPSGATGAVGNYYEDTSNGVLYGPKRAGTVSGAVLSEPFDNLTAWTSIVPTWTTATGRNGTGARSDYNAALAYNLAAPNQTDTVTVGFAFRVTTLTISTTALVALRSDSGATEHVGVYFAGVPGHFDIKRGGTTTLATSAGGQLTAGSWAYIELQAKLHDTAGFATLRVNGTQIATFPTGDTRNAGTKTVFDQVRIGALSSGSGNNDFDDLYIKTAPGSTFAGDVALGSTATVIWPVTVRTVNGYQASSVALSDLAAKWVPASAAGSATLSFAEDTDNGTNVLTLTGPATLGSNATVTFPASSGQMCLIAVAQTLTNKTIDLASNTVTGTIAQFNTACIDADFATTTRTITTYSAVSNTGVIGDAGAYLRFTGTNPTYTVPPNSSVAFPVGTQIDGIGTATAMTLVQGSGVTITRARTLVTVGAGSGWTLIKTGTDTWDAHGDCV